MEKTCSGQYIDGKAPSLHLCSCTLNDPWIQFSSEFHQCLIEMQNPNLMRGTVVLLCCMCGQNVQYVSAFDTVLDDVVLLYGQSQLNENNIEIQSYCFVFASTL
jgi:hypothetical protein